MSDTRKEIGKRIKQLRTSRDLKLKEVASEAGFTAGYLSEIERGNSALSSEKLASLGRVFGVSTDYLLTGFEPSPSTTPADIKIPAGLSRLAVQHNLKYEQTMRLLEGYRSLIAYRTKDEQIEPVSTQEDWEAFYGSVKDYL